MLKVAVRIMVIASLFSAAQVGLARVARADEAAERAKRHNAAARKLFNLGMFREAAAEYKKAYDAKQAPDLLYNLAQCHARLRAQEDLERAKFYLESYLRNAPSSPIRASVEKELAALNKKIERRKAGGDKGPSVPFYKTWWFWTAVGVAVTSAAVAVTVTSVQPEDPVMGTADPGVFNLP